MTFVKLIQKLMLFLALTNHQASCNMPEKKNLENISFTNLCVDDRTGFFCDQDFYLQGFLEEKNLVSFMIRNNVYDTLYIPLYRSRKCNQVFFIKSDHIDYYHYENDSLVDYAGDLIYLAPTDTIFKLLKEEEMRFLAIVPCTGQGKEKAVHNFTFEADSIGNHKTVHLTYRTW